MITSAFLSFAFQFPQLVNPTLRTYAYLIYMSRNLKSGADGFYRRYTSRREISAASGIDETNSHRVLRELENLGLLSVERREKCGSFEKIHLALVNVDVFENSFQGLKYKEICEKLVNGRFVKSDEQKHNQFVKSDERGEVSLYYRKKKLKVLRRRGGTSEPSVPCSTVADRNLSTRQEIPKAFDVDLSFSQEKEINNDLDNNKDISIGLGISNINTIDMVLKGDSNAIENSYSMAIDLDHTSIGFDALDVLEATEALEGGLGMGRMACDLPAGAFASFGGIVEASEWGSQFIEAATTPPDHAGMVEASILSKAKESAQYAPPDGVENFRLESQQVSIPVWLVDERKSDFEFSLKRIASGGHAFVVAMTCGERVLEELKKRVDGVGEYWLVDRKNKMYSAIRILDDFIDVRSSSVDEKKNARLEKSQKALASFGSASEKVQEPVPQLTFAQRQMMAMNKEKKKIQKLSKPSSNTESIIANSESPAEVLKHLGEKPVTATVMYHWYSKRFTEITGLQPVQPTVAFLSMFKHVLRSLETHGVSRPLEWLEWVMTNWSAISAKFGKYRGNEPHIHWITTDAFFSETWMMYQVPKNKGASVNSGEISKEKQELIKKLNFNFLTEEDL
jgi:hypothetical protein